MGEKMTFTRAYDSIPGELPEFVFDDLSQDRGPVGVPAPHKTSPTTALQFEGDCCAGMVVHQAR